MTDASLSCLDIGPWLVKIKRIVVVAASSLNLASHQIPSQLFEGANLPRSS
jgi:hypothetical protein